MLAVPKEPLPRRAGISCLTILFGFSHVKQKWMSDPLGEVLGPMTETKGIEKKQMFGRKIVGDFVVDVGNRDELSGRSYETISPERRLLKLSWRSFLEVNWVMRMDGGSKPLH